MKDYYLDLFKALSNLYGSVRRGIAYDDNLNVLDSGELADMPARVQALLDHAANRLFLIKRWDDNR